MFSAKFSIIFLIMTLFICFVVAVILWRFLNWLRKWHYPIGVILLIILIMPLCVIILLDTFKACRTWSRGICLVSALEKSKPVDLEYFLETHKEEFAIRSWANLHYGDYANTKTYHIWFQGSNSKTAVLFASRGSLIVTLLFPEPAFYINYNEINKTVIEDDWSIHL